MGKGYCEEIRAKFKRNHAEVRRNSKRSAAEVT